MCEVRLACFYPASVFCAWSVSSGLVDTLQGMGHETLALPIDAGSVCLKTDFYPAFTQLRQFDGVVISGPEPNRPHLLALCPEWGRSRVPRVSWMHETVEREDLGVCGWKPRVSLAEGIRRALKSGAAKQAAGGR